MTRYISRAEFWLLAELITEIDTQTLLRISRVDLADSALNAPAAWFEQDDFYPNLFDKAAVLACRIAWNHPLPDGNKRAAWVSLTMFVELNGGSWNAGQPQVDDAVAAMIAVAGRTVDEKWLAEWLRQRITFPAQT